jgi:hypothetical protein
VLFRNPPIRRQMDDAIGYIPESCVSIAGADRDQVGKTAGVAEVRQPD